MPHTSEREAAFWAQRMCSSLQRSQIATNAGELSITASFGVAGMASADDTPDSLLIRADEALYTAKQMGRNCVCEHAKSVACQAISSYEVGSRFGSCPFTNMLRNVALFEHKDSITAVLDVLASDPQLPCVLVADEDGNLVGGLYRNKLFETLVNDVNAHEKQVSDLQPARLECFSDSLRALDSGLLHAAEPSRHDRH